jgi:hypothetical protein
LAVDCKETWELVLFHHKSVGPHLYKREKLLLSLLPAHPYRLAQQLQFDLIELASADFEHTEQGIDKGTRTDCLQEEHRPVLATEIQKRNQLLLSDTIVNRENWIDFFGKLGACF